MVKNHNSGSTVLVKIANAKIKCINYVILSSSN